MNILKADAEAIAKAAAVLKTGGLVIVPTETVYGLAALASDESAIRRVFLAKGRGFDKALPVQIADAAMLDEVAVDVNKPTKRLAERLWPGPLTLIVRKHSSLPEMLTAGGDTVAVRIPDHPVALALLRAVGEPLAVTSANVSGEAPAVSCVGAVSALEQWVEIALEGGDCRIGVPSTVVDATGSSPVIVRQGAISDANIMDTLKEHS